MNARQSRHSTRRISVAALSVLFLSVPHDAAAQATTPAAIAQPPAAPGSSAALPPAAAAPPSPADARAAAPQAGSSPESFDLEAALVAPSDGLTSDDVGKRARERAPQIASAEATALSAQWDARGQTSAFYPQVQLSAQFLTPREREVLGRLVQGSSTQELAEAMGVGVATVRSHVQAMLSKLGVRSRLEAVTLAVAHGLHEPPQARLPHRPV